MISSRVLLAVLALAAAAPSDAFVTPGLALRGSVPSLVSAKGIRTKAIAPTMQIQELADGANLIAQSIYPAPMVGGITAYMNLYVPIFKSLNLPPALLHWGHPLAMGSVLATMGVYGTYLGWWIRNDKTVVGNLAPGPAWANLGKTVSELHKTLMGGMAVIFFLGANGGLVLALTQDKPIMESGHFTTAMAGFVLLAMQAALSTRFKGENAATARTTHAFLGSATMAVFFYHAYLGLQLGLEYSKAI